MQVEVTAESKLEGGSGDGVEELGGAHWFHFQGPIGQELGDRILKDRHSKGVWNGPCRAVSLSYLSQWATCFGIIKEAG